MKHFYVITNVQKDPEQKVAQWIQKYLQGRDVACTIQGEEECPLGS